MPPFQLEFYKDSANRKRNERIIFTKAAYNVNVKITDWEKYRESEPIDTDPLCPGNVNHHLSHYKRLGIEPDEKYVTTTQLMLEQINKKEHVLTNPNKHLINYYTYNDTMDCELDSMPSVCPPICSEKYYSTMQNSYRPPDFYKLNRVALPKIPHMQYRKFLFEDPRLSEYKFYDEGFHIKTRTLMCNKRNQWISFNPCTGLYNNGKAPEDNPRSCVCLNYDEN